MARWHSWFRWILVAVAATSLAACFGGGGDDDDDDPGDIVAVASENGFDALLAAAEKAGLVEALSADDASLTVFAPTDAAFDTLAEQLGFADAAALVDALPAATLARILSYHVLPTERSAAELAADDDDEPTLYVFEGEPATVDVEGDDGGVTLTDAALTTARVTTADVQARNGVVHAIDKVLIPPGVLTVLQMAQVNPDLQSLVGAVEAADLQATLNGAGPFTVFAPTDDAFEAIASTVEGLTTAQLTTVLTYHVLPAQVLAADIPFGDPVETVAGQTITIEEGSPPTITDTTDTPAPIVATDVRASNGVVHVISKVLIPDL